MEEAPPQAEAKRRRRGRKPPTEGLPHERRQQERYEAMLTWKRAAQAEVAALGARRKTGWSGEARARAARTPEPIGTKSSAFDVSRRAEHAGAHGCRTGRRTARISRMPPPGCRVT